MAFTPGDRKHLFESVTLGSGVPELAVRPREIHPQRLRLRVVFAGDLEMMGGGARVRAVQRIQSKRVANCGILAIEREGSFQVFARLARQSRLPGAVGVCQMLLDTAGRHAPVEADQGPPVKKSQDRARLSNPRF